MKKKKTGRFLTGILLIAVGCCTLCANLDIDVFGKWRRVIFSLPMALILVGVVALWGRNWVSGLGLLGFGVFFTLSKLPVQNLVQPDFEATWWPLLLIYLGCLLLLFKKSGGFQARDSNGSEYLDEQEPQRTADGVLDVSVFLSGQKAVVSDPVFAGGSVRATIGGVELDLRNTSLAEGETHLHCSALFGGITLLVPGNWNVLTTSSGLAGGIKDSRKEIAFVDTRKILVVHMNATFGGGEIR